MAFTQRKSIFGRQLGITSTGGLVTAPQGSTVHGQVAQMWGTGMLETVSSAGSDVRNYGMTVLSSDSTSGTSPFFLQAPVAGVEKEVYLQTSATLIHLNTTSTLIKINSTSAVNVAGGSTVFIAANAAAAGLGHEVLVLRGGSTTAWYVRSMTAGWSS
jgi:hypothetical protein